MIIYGYCHCGCGNKTNLAEKTNSKRGIRLGEPYCYLKGHASPRISIETRFWSKVDMKGPDDCWEWQASKNERGYGRFYNEDRMFPAHLVAWELTNGPIHNGFHALHKCDNPPCCNPGHLFSGTQSDNMIDMVEKGRDNPQRGEKSPNAKLKTEDVMNIRKIFQTSMVTKTHLANQYNVSLSLIKAIIGYRAWKHL